MVAASTDLSDPYDTVDHKVLLMKFEYYGVEGRELALLTSYLHNRKQYTDINTMNRSQSPAYRVESCREANCQDYYTPEHVVVNFVDDSRCHICQTR